MKKIILIITIIVMASGCASARKDVAPEDVITVSEEELVTDDDSAEYRTERISREELEEAPSIYSDYRIQAGDRFEISVWGEPEMTRDLVVVPDGTISYFLVGEIEAVGKTFMELRQEIENRLARYIIEPRVTILGREFAGTFATLLGALESPGNYPVSQTDRLLDLIAKAGGLRYMVAATSTFQFAGDIANLRLAYLSRGGKLVDVDFVALLDRGDMSQNIRVHPGDFIYIPSAMAEQVYILGEVNRPIGVPYRANTTLMQAITFAYGFIEETARKNSIIIISGGVREPASVRRVNFNKIMSGKESDFLLEPGDIVYVPSTFITDINRAAVKVIPMLDVILKGDSALDVYQRRYDTWNPYKLK